MGKAIFIFRVSLNSVQTGITQEKVSQCMSGSQGKASQQSQNVTHFYYIKYHET